VSNKRSRAWPPAIHNGGLPRPRLFLRPYFRTPAYGELGGDTFGCAGFHCGRSANPALARRPHLGRCPASSLHTHGTAMKVKKQVKVRADNRDRDQVGTPHIHGRSRAHLRVCFQAWRSFVRRRPNEMREVL
jgi:hypothetical protein